MIFNKDSGLTGDQWASQHVCCSASWQLWQVTVIPQSSVHFWGLWQKGSSEELSRLSWSVTTYRQTMVSDGFCSCTRLSLTDVTPVQTEACAALQSILWLKVGKRAEYCREIWIDKGCRRGENTLTGKFWRQKENVVAAVRLAEATRPPSAQMAVLCSLQNFIFSGYI